MFGLFATFLSLIKFEEVSVDNQVFKLHYRATVILLIIFSVLITSKEHFGAPIRCYMPGGSIPYQVLNAFCWVIPSFTVDKHHLGNHRQTSLIQGVGPYVEGEDAVTPVQYYQWVAIVLLFQAFLFYAPHFLWSCWEGGRVQMLCRDLGDPLVGPEWNPERRRLLAEYLSRKYTTMHNLYAVQFALCEALNLVNVMGQMFFLNIFFQGAFMEYGVALSKYFASNGTVDHNPMDKLFPKVTKCTFRKFGPSGSLINLDIMCVLPLNAVNEKVFAILWYWFIILTLLSTIAAVYRAALIASPALRCRLLLASTHQIARTQVQRLNASLSFGAWFMLNQLSKNIHPTVFRELLTEMYKNHSSYAVNFKNKQNCLS